MSPIIVLADDLSGAAELAGVAFARGLSAEVQREFAPASDAQVIAVDSDSRNLPPAEAAQRIAQLAGQVLAAQPAWLFLKVDSLLRGNVRAQIEAVQALGYRRTVLIPANPSRGRVVIEGTYFVQGVPLDQSPLADDPNHPRKAASVVELLGEGRLPVHRIAADMPLPDCDIAVPDVADAEDIRRRCRQCDEATLPVGAADFFAALLEERAATGASCEAATPALKLAHPALLICGSRAAWRDRVLQCQAAGIPIEILPASLRQKAATADALELVADLAAAHLQATGVLLLGIGEEAPAKASPDELLRRLSVVAAKVMQRQPIRSLLVEGGATAAALAEQLGWTRLRIAAAAPAGIGVLGPIGAPQAAVLWIKPGSYPWPLDIWRWFAKS